MLLWVSKFAAAKIECTQLQSLASKWTRKYLEGCIYFAGDGTNAVLCS